MALQRDIVERVRSDFDKEADEAIGLLRSSRQNGRVARCIVVASRGSLDLLKDYLQLAKLDFRDAIAAGEYDASRRQVRDLRVSFLLDSPETFWVGEVALMMATRRYRLTALESRAATIPPFNHTCDRSEGRAKFTGPEGDLEVEKKDHQWSVHGDLKELEKHNMNRIFDDDRTFRDAVSAYILSRRRPSS